MILPSVRSFPLIAIHHHPSTQKLSILQDGSVRQKMTVDDGDNDDSSDSAAAAAAASSSSLRKEIRFLGRGKEAIVRPGVVLIAPPDEFHHFLREAAVFIYAMGEDEDDVYVIRGVILDHPTAFTMHEMMPEGQATLDGETSEVDSIDDSSKPVAQYLQNLLYRGGERGDAVFMLHSDQRLGEQADQEVIGSSGIYQGGLEHAQQNHYDIPPDRCKFFFSYMEFTEIEINEMLENREDANTQWVSVEVPPDFVLKSDWERGEAWARLRNAVRDK